MTDEFDQHEREEAQGLIHSVRLLAWFFVAAGLYNMFRWATGFYNQLNVVRGVVVAAFLLGGLLYTIATPNAAGIGIKSFNRRLAAMIGSLFLAIAAYFIVAHVL